MSKRSEMQMHESHQPTKQFTPQQAKNNCRAAIHSTKATGRWSAWETNLVAAKKHHVQTSQ